MVKYTEGATRKVFVCNKFVIKIPNFKEYRLFLFGILANMQEKEWSGRHRDLAKVLYCFPFGLFLIMEKAYVIGERMKDNESWLFFSEMIEERYKNDELKEFILSDAKPYNWGYIGDRLVKIDYGS